AGGGVGAASGAGAPAGRAAGRQGDHRLLRRPVLRGVAAGRRAAARARLRGQGPARRADLLAALRPGRRGSLVPPRTALGPRPSPVTGEYGVTSEVVTL